MNKILLALLALLASAAVWAEEFTQGAAQGPVYVYRSADLSFDLVKENLEMAITGSGLKVSGTLHVQEMLERTGPDLGFTSPYSQAESLEFCSASFSHKMTQASPLNLSICPFTIALFVKADEPEQVYLAFRRPELAGDAQAVQEEIRQFMHRLSREALELD